MIVKGDIVYHELSKLYFICENKKQEKWMNMNSFYTIFTGKLNESYFKKN